MQIRNLRYDPVDGLFQASVDIKRAGRTFRYPCEVPGPRDMEPALVMKNLHQRALKMSDSRF